MTTNEASRADFERWAVENLHPIAVRDDGSGKYVSTLTNLRWDGWQAALAALASRPVEASPVASKIDSIHGDKREVIINALCASSNWMRGYAEAFVDDFVDGKAEYVAVGDLEEVMRKEGIYAGRLPPEYRVVPVEYLRSLINQVGEK